MQAKVLFEDLALEFQEHLFPYDRTSFFSDLLDAEYVEMRHITSEEPIHLVHTVATPVRFGGLEIIDNGRQMAVVNLSSSLKAFTELDYKHPLLLNLTTFP